MCVCVSERVSARAVAGCRDAMAVFAMEAASIISERSLEISFASALSTVSASGVNVNAGLLPCTLFSL